jgi:hypothetical protein
MLKLSALFSRKVLICLVVSLTALLAGCGYLPPSRSVPEDRQSPLFKAPALASEVVATEATTGSTPEPTQVPNCKNDLEYIQDLSIPDGTQLSPLKVIEKEWKVKNSGTCNWNSSYSVRLISGSELGAETTQALVPARNGTEAIIRIEFTAPTEPGKYTATWQAYDPDGQPFGEWLSIDIAVTTP